MAPHWQVWWSESCIRSGFTLSSGSRAQAAERKPRLPEGQTGAAEAGVGRRHDEDGDEDDSGRSEAAILLWTPLAVEEARMSPAGGFS